MLVQVKDRVAVVTGGAHRVGRAIVLGLAADGARVVVHYNRSREAAEDLAGQVGGHAAQADLSHPEGAQRLTDQVLRLGGELALWVNAASTFHRRPFVDAADELWRSTLQLVVLSPASLVRRIAPAMVEGGVVVNILDVAAHQPWKGYAHHCVAKAALMMLTRALALELAPRLRVCGVSPGVVLPSEQMDEGEADRLLRRIPLGRPGDPSDVVQAVRYLVQADYLTGTVVTVDGGLTSQAPT